VPLSIKSRGAVWRRRARVRDSRGDDGDCLGGGGCWWGKD